MQASKEAIDSVLEHGGLVDITTTGRESGQPRRLEIVFHNIGGKIYISGIPSPQRRSWLANLEADPHLTFHLKRGIQADLPATARIIDDEKERREILGPIAQAWGRRGEEALESMVRYSPLIEVTIDR
jgi:deazaflavin-dependent oxidoreductase (nitroreductase family)